ncbi:hypothetical protein OAQ99_04775 [Candidatus Kapabacteria bacterium]|nr:hypothetical protein [Candidatus Kapabacteria bacterium]
MTKLLTLSILILLGISCSESDIDKEAQQITKLELENTAGYEWFISEYQNYEPDNILINSINNNLDTDEKLLLFIKPSCQCRGTQKDFPQLMKSIDLATIPQNKLEIYSMKEDYTHPYLNEIQFSELPQAYLVKSGKIRYSIFDSLNNYRTDDENLENKDKVEFYLSQAMNK